MRSRLQLLAQVQALVLAMPDRCAGMTFTLFGKSYTTTQFVALCQGVLDASHKTLMAKAALQAALQNEEAVIASDGPIVAGMRQHLAVAFGTDLPALAALEVAPRKKPAPLSNDALLAKVAKARATRAVRGTKGPRQKAKIKGTVTGVTITPVTDGKE